MAEHKEYSISIPRSNCLEYCEGNKKMFVEVDLREKTFDLSLNMITHWEKPYDDIEIGLDKKKDSFIRFFYLCFSF